MTHPSSQKYKDFLLKKNLRYTLAIIASLYFIFLLFIGINSCSSVYFSVKTKETEISRFLNHTYASYRSEMESLTLNEVIQKALSGDLASVTEANRLLYQCCNSQPVRSNFILLKTDGTLISTSLYTPNLETFSNSQILPKILRSSENSPAGLHISSSSLYYENSQTGSILFSQAIPDTSGRPAGILVFDLRYDDLFEYFHQYHFSRVVITDWYNNILFDTEHASVPNTKLYTPTKYYGSEDSLFSRLFRGDSYYVTQTAIPGNELQIFTHSSLVFQEQLLTYGTCFIAVLLLLSVWITCHISHSFTARNLVAIDEVVEAARHIGQGDLDYQLSTQTFDEFQILNDALNNLTRNLKKLDSEKQELNRHKQILEIKQLKSQFNPHFVFNTLESIRYSIILKPDTAANMTLCLSRLLRYNMDSGSGETDLKTDLDFLENYLSLQKMRFGPCLEYSVHAQPELFSYRLPKNLLQPVVENCLNHGMRRCKSIFVQLNAVSFSDCVSISVSDNGDGIDPDILADLNESFRSGYPMGDHFGLYSVTRIVRLLYGSDFGLSIDSSPGSGTRVTLRLPPVGASQKHILPSSE